LKNKKVDILGTRCIFLFTHKHMLARVNS